MPSAITASLRAKKTNDNRRVRSATTIALLNVGFQGLTAGPFLQYRQTGATAMAETEIIFAVQESPEGGYEARALGQSIYTQAASLPELKDLVRDAVRCHFDDASRPRLIRLHMLR